MLIRVLVAASLVSIASWAAPQTKTTHIKLGDLEIGQNIYVKKAGGEFESTTHIEVGGTKVDSRLFGVMKDGVLTEVVVEEGAGKNSAKVEWKGGKMTVTRNGKVDAKDVPFDMKSKAYLASYHPQILGSIFHELAKKGGSGELEIINLSTFATVKFKFDRSTQVSDGPSGKFTAVILKSDFSGIGIEFAFTETGEPLGMKVPVQNATFVLEGYEKVFVDPMSKYPELSQPTFKTRTVKRVRMATRDGVRLMADLAIPDKEGKYPTVLIRTPYGRAASLAAYDWLARRGYVVMSQDVRGMAGSDGDWDPLIHEKSDGKDTLDWIVSQSWSDGKVGMIGGSYLGYVQWAAASTGHPALRCIIPQVSPPPPDANFPWDHGCFMLLPNLWWCRVVKDRTPNMSGAFDQLTNMNAIKTLPLDKADDKFLGQNIPFFDKWVRRATLADWKDVFTLDDVRKVKIPVMHISGTWDGDGIGTMLHWQAQRQGGGNQWVVFGPWNHLFNQRTTMGDTDYGADSVLELDSNYLRFFDTFLKGKNVNQDGVPRVRFFETGANKWIVGQDWPLPTAKTETLYFSGGRAVGAKGQGRLSSTPGSGRDTYTYDPNNVRFKADNVDVKAEGGSTTTNLAGLGNNAAIYRSSPFDKSQTVAGPVKISLSVSSSAKDASFHAMLCDEDEKGKTELICMVSSCRATYVDGSIKLLAKGEVRTISLEPWWFAHRFPSGHRLVVVILSDMFPQFARNPGTGEPDWKATKLIKAKQTIWKSAIHPSSITYYTLPVAK